MTNAGNRIFPQALISFDTSTFSGSYQFAGTAVNENRVIKFINNSNVIVTVSWDGTNDHDVYPALSGAVYDVEANQQSNSTCVVPPGQPFYLKGSSGSGLFYIIQLYGY